MLILSRKTGQKIALPELGVEINIEEIRGDHVRLSFVAPPSIAIHRQEVWERIQAERKPNDSDTV